MAQPTRKVLQSSSKRVPVAQPERFAIGSRSGTYRYEGHPIGDGCLTLSVILIQTREGRLHTRVALVGPTTAALYWDNLPYPYSTLVRMLSSLSSVFDPWDLFGPPDDSN